MSRGTWPSIRSEDTSNSPAPLTNVPADSTSIVIMQYMEYRTKHAPDEVNRTLYARASSINRLAVSTAGTFRT